jgi:hypothetical protein
MAAPHNKWSNYENAGKQTLGGAKSIIQSEINSYAVGINYTMGVASTCQEAAFSTSTEFESLAGASMEAVFSPFQMSTAVSEWLPTFLNDGEAACDGPFSDQVDPPVKQFTRLSIYAKYLNPFKRPGDPCHGANGGDVHYDGIILFNGDVNDNQNMPNRMGDDEDFPTALRPIALRGPLMLQGWGYDLHGKPIPNSLDGEANARAGIFQGMDDARSSSFLNGWMTKRETWPVGPVDLKFDRDRKVWTIPSRYRMIEACASGVGDPPGAIMPGEGGIAIVKNGDLAPIYNENGVLLTNQKTISIKNPAFGIKLCHGDCFFAVFDTLTCSYEVMPNPPKFSAFNTGCFDSSGCAMDSTGCITGLSTRDFTIVAARHLEAKEMLLSGLCPGEGCCPPPCLTTKALMLEAVIPVGSMKIPPDKLPLTLLDREEVCDWDSIWFETGTHALGTFISDSGCKTLVVSGIPFPVPLSAFNTGCLDSGNCATNVTGCLTGMDNVIVAARHLAASYMSVPRCPTGTPGVPSSGLKLDVEIPIAGKAKVSGNAITSSVCDWDELWFDPKTLPTYEFTGEFGCKVLAVSGGTFLKDSAQCGADSEVPECTGIQCVTFGTGLIVTNNDPDVQIDVDVKIGLTGAGPAGGRGTGIDHLGALLVGSGLELTSVGDCDWMITASGIGSGSGSGTGVSIVGETNCGVTATITACTGVSCIKAGTGLILSAEGGDAYRIDSDLKIGYTGHGGARGPMSHLRGLRIGSGLKVTSVGDCDYTLIATGGGGGSCSGNKQFSYVSAVCCSGSGIGVKYGTAYFVDGCFSGVIAEECETG